MGFDQSLITEIETGPRNRAVNHSRTCGEKVLIVRITLGGECHDERRLAASSGAPATLSIVCRRGRHISQMDCVKVANVYAELHRGRTA